jgi:diazepam-binding inhibitor (GABA receptor modulator, acyl-CoA-binding protein)
MDLKAEFDSAVENSKALTQRPDNETLLRLYALYKQAEHGDIQTAPPENVFDFVAKAKYNAWLAHKGKSKDVARQEYVDLVKTLH